MKKLILAGLLGCALMSATIIGIAQGQYNAQVVFGNPHNFTGNISVTKGTNNVASKPLSKPFNDSFSLVQGGPYSISILITEEGELKRITCDGAFTLDGDMTITVNSTSESCTINCPDQNGVCNP